MKKVPEKNRESWRKARETRNEIKNDELKQASDSLLESLQILRVTEGKLDIQKEFKNKIIIFSKSEITKNDNKKKGITVTVITKPRQHINRHDRLKSIIYVSSCGCIKRTNQRILTSFYNVSQATISADIKHLEENDLLCPDFE